MTPIAPQMRLDHALASALLGSTRRALLVAESDAATLADPALARRSAATAVHLRNRVSRLRAEMGASRP